MVAFLGFVAQHAATGKVGGSAHTACRLFTACTGLGTLLGFVSVCANTAVDWLVGGWQGVAQSCGQLATSSGIPATSSGKLYSSVPDKFFLSCVHRDPLTTSSTTWQTPLASPLPPTACPCPLCTEPRVLEGLLTQQVGMRLSTTSVMTRCCAAHACKMRPPTVKDQGCWCMVIAGVPRQPAAAT